MRTETCLKGDLKAASYLFPEVVTHIGEMVACLGHPPARWEHAAEV